MSSFITNWNQETASGEFYAISNTPKKLCEWAKEIKKARQLELNESFIAAKLKSFANAKRDVQIMKTHNTGLPMDSYKCMFVGVWITDYSLYRNVTDKFHLMLNQAVSKTMDEVRLISTSSLPLNISAIIVTSISPIVAFVQVLRKIDAFQKWTTRVRTGGEWDYKNKPDNPFGKPTANIKEYSRFFYYAGYQGKSYTHSYNKKGLMRNDDPGNLIYAATGAEVLIPIYSGKFEQILVKFGAEAYAAKGDGELSDGAKLAYKAGALDLKNIDVALFDDAHDIAVINWGYQAYAENIITEHLPTGKFRQVLKAIMHGG